MMKEQEVYQEIGKRVRTVRTWRGMTQADLARSIRLSRTSITNVESGKQRLTAWHMLQLSFVFGVPNHLWLSDPEAWANWCNAAGLNGDTR